MIFNLELKNSNEVKISVDAKSLKAAIRYFSSFEHLDEKDLMRLFKVEQRKNVVRESLSGKLNK